MPSVNPGPLDLDILRRDAISLARLAIETARRYAGRVSTQRKPDDSPVTEADHAAQDALLDRIAAEHPDHAILVEETVTRPERHRPVTESEYCWIVDPIDGTRNFAAGVPVFAASVGVLYRGVPVAGAIHESLRDITYSAAVDRGAFCGNARLDASSRPSDSDVLVAISSFRRSPMPDAVRAWLDRYNPRNYGSLTLHLAWVAAGLLDAALAVEAKLWDIAAGSLIVEQAGGVITDTEGRSLWPFDLASYARDDIPILAGTPARHAELLASLHTS